MSTFDRYAPFIQDFIYAHEWEALRGVQVAAADALFNTDDHVLLTSSTASGKTEAAFFPIITMLYERPPASVGALYVGPLKALINDQFMRLTDLCAEADVPVWHWHGDVAASHKERLMKKPSGILQITPESLEALLLHKHSAIPKLFGDLRFVVIDELHALLRGDRGLQALCLIQRLCRLAGCDPRRVGLSATIGDPTAAAALLAAGTPRPCCIPEVEETRTTWRLAIEHFWNESHINNVEGPAGSSGVPAGTIANTKTSSATQSRVEIEQSSISQSNLMSASGAHKEEAPVGLPTRSGSAVPKGTPEASAGPAPQVDTPAAADPGLAYIYRESAGRKCLVFSNSREECEAVCSTLRSYAEHMGAPNRFLIHHGNLSQSFRETAEDIMRQDDVPATTCTTATLELGIDIGRLERAFQIDAPFTVSSFLQRMGRTGRRGQPPEMRFVVREEVPEPRALAPETIPWKLVQACALVQLYLEERWVEPPRGNRLPYSLLYHQTMATLASGGEMTPATLAQQVLTLTPFASVSQDDFRCLLHHLLETDHIEQTELGGLIVGLAGERVVNNFRFYGTFVESEEYTVRAESQELGTVVQPPPPGEKLAIAGAVWLVEEIDHKRRLVYCTQVKGQVPAYFGECPGDIDTHILERMRRVLAEDTLYSYLQPSAATRLAQARHVAAAAGIGRNALVNLGGDTWALFPWLGTYAFIALERIIKLRLPAHLGVRGVDSYRPYYLQFRMDATPEAFMAELQAATAAHFDPLELVYPGEVPYFDKYDFYLPEYLVRKGFAHGVLDLQTLRARLNALPEPRP